MATIDLSKCAPEQRKQYSRMLRRAGKGDAMRNVWSKDFRDNYDLIKWRKKAQTKAS